MVRPWPFVVHYQQELRLTKAEPSVCRLIKRTHKATDLFGLMTGS